MIGVPARNEAERIGELVERVELGTVSLPGDVHSELVLAYQQSDDDTLERFTARPARLPHEVVSAPPGVLGKGANIKLLLRHACNRGVDQVLLVDADLQSYAPGMCAAHSTPRVAGGTDWCCLCGAVRVGRAIRRITSRVRCCSQRIVPASDNRSQATCCSTGRSSSSSTSTRCPMTMASTSRLTMRALATRTSIGQVMLAPPAHPTKNGSSERVMVEVATALSSGLRELPTIDRADATWPDAFWADWHWPRSVGDPRDHLDVVRRFASGDALQRWLALVDAGDDEVAEMWCEHLTGALRAVPIAVCRRPGSGGRPGLSVLRPRRASRPPHLLRRRPRDRRRRLRPPSRCSNPRMSRVAVLAPHPDDEVLGCASVMVEHDTLVVHVTDGVPLNVGGKHRAPGRHPTPRGPGGTSQARCESACHRAARCA